MPLTDRRPDRPAAAAVAAAAGRAPRAGRRADRGATGPGPGGQIPHPVEDFLFTYYSLRPGAAAPLVPGRRGGAGRCRRSGRTGDSTGAAGSADRAAARPADRCHRRSAGLPAGPRRAARLHRHGCSARRRPRPGSSAASGCTSGRWSSGRTTAQRRHQEWPLRLGQAGTDDVVRDHQIRCTHYDAFRFFTPPARPLQRCCSRTWQSRVDDGAAGLPARLDGHLQVGLQADSGGAERPAAGLLSSWPSPSGSWTCGRRRTT